MTDTADVIVVGAGVQGASLAFHLARRGASVIVLERGAVGGAATGRSSGFVRMHYDLASEARLAWASFPYFQDWAGRRRRRRPGVRPDRASSRSVPPTMADNLRANVATQQALGVDDARRRPGRGRATSSPASSPTTSSSPPTSRSPATPIPPGTAAGFIAAARARWGSPRPGLPGGPP